MKKLGIVLILIIFPLCLLAGFKISDILFSAVQPSPTPSPAPVSIDPSRKTLFLIHVDRLNAPQPRLESVWIMFALFSDPPGITFVPLASGESAAALSEAFALRPDRLVAPEFIQTLQEISGVHNQGYLLMDDQALISFASSFAQLLPGEQITAPDGERLAIHGLCAMLRAGDARHRYEFPWQELVPEHFKSDLILDEFMNSWIRVSQQKNPPVCKLIAD